MTAQAKAKSKGGKMIVTHNRIAIYCLVFLLQLLMLPSAYASDRFAWMDANIMSLGSILPTCIEVPDNNSINESNKTLNVQTDNNLWIPTGVYVEGGKMLSMIWNAQSVKPQPRKYRVLYRIDPRFTRPQVYIAKYDYTQQKYLSDFNTYKNGALPLWQQSSLFYSQQLRDFDNYFNFVNRPKISVNKGEVINISLNTVNEFWGADTDFVFTFYLIPYSWNIYNNTSNMQNRTLYASAARWCDDIIKTVSPTYNTKCNIYPGQYISIIHDTVLFPSTYISMLDGNQADPEFMSQVSSIPSCPDNTNGPDNNPVCYYDQGRGMSIMIGGTVIKDNTQKFIRALNGKDILYYHSAIDGDLDFVTSWPISGMYNNLMQNMIQWQSFADDSSGDISLISNYLSSHFGDASMNFIHFGSYSMEIEIGSATATLSQADLDSIQVDYFISDTATPDILSSSRSVDQNFKANAYASGYLWLKVTGAQNQIGTINVKIANYTGSNWFSSLVYGSLISPLKDKYNELAKLIYNKFISNPTFQGIVKSLLILYIIIYGLAFLAGAVQITITDVILRVVKVGVIVALISQTSWNFFNNNLFTIFVDGTNYLLTSIVGVTSDVSNIFGFVDPILNRYSNPNLWALLAIQLLQIHNGLAFFALLTIYSILTYFRAILEVIVSYCLAFLGIAVMISLAPFFIVLMLFEKTKSMFDNWLSTLFSYMIQPTVLLIFFLLLDQLIGQYVTDVVTKACWGVLIPLKIGIDLSHVGIPISFAFSLPFLPGIPFYIPVVNDIGSISEFFDSNGTFVRVATSSFIFFIYSKLAGGLIDYVTLVVQYLTNVLAARREGRLQEADSSNLIRSVMKDIEKAVSPITSTLRGVGNFTKEKFIDQKITYRSRKQRKEPYYSEIRETGTADGGDEGGGDGILSDASKTAIKDKVGIGDNIPAKDKPVSEADILAKDDPGAARGKPDAGSEKEVAGKPMEVSDAATKIDATKTDAASKDAVGAKPRNNLQSQIQNQDQFLQRQEQGRGEQEPPKKQERAPEFDTSKAGIGKKADKLSDAQLKEAQEVFRKKRGIKINRAGDDRARKSKDKNKDDA